MSHNSLRFLLYTIIFGNKMWFLLHTDMVSLHVSPVIIHLTLYELHLHGLSPCFHSTSVFMILRDQIVSYVLYSSETTVVLRTVYVYISMYLFLSLGAYILPTLYFILRISSLISYTVLILDFIFNLPVRIWVLTLVLLLQLMACLYNSDCYLRPPLGPWWRLLPK